MIELLKKLWNDNPSITALTATIGLGFISSIIYFLKDILLKLVKFINNQYLTSLSIDNTNKYFYCFVRYLIQNNKLTGIRHLNLSGVTGEENLDAQYISPNLELIDSSTFIILERTFIKMKITSEIIQFGKQSRKLITITLTKFGRSYDLFTKLLNQLKAYIKTDEGPGDYNSYFINKHYRSQILKENVSLGFNSVNANWVYCTSYKRSFDSIYIKQDIINQLTQRIEFFINNKEYYTKHDIPYHLGILLVGKPGVGKSSLIKALLSYFDLNGVAVPINRIHILEKNLNIITEWNSLDKHQTYIDNLNSMVGNEKEEIFDVDHKLKESISCGRIMELTVDDFEKAYKLADEELSSYDYIKKHLYTYILEDIDGSNASLKRENGENLISEEIAEDGTKSLWNISNLLNSIDGIHTPNNFIIIATTNHIEKLDPALIRPGRFDLVIEIPTVDKEVFDKFTNNFYGKILDKDIKFNKEYSIADLQEMVLRGFSFEELIKKVTL